MGRSVYTGIFEPSHPTATPDGFRGDVLELVRELGVTIVRYPGGNFVSGYRWEDGVGAIADRPVRLNLAWHTLEPNRFGTDEFVRWCAQAGVEPMLAVNLGTRGVQEAVDLLEYANHPSGTALSDARIANGSPTRHRIRMWCLGNEMDGHWQLGHKTAAEYGRLAAETARAMRQLDPGVELVAVGSSGPWMPTYVEWERTVLRETAELIDAISLHNYYQEDPSDVASFLASAVDLDRFIERVSEVVDEFASARGQGQPVKLSVDEWNVSRSNGAPLPADWTVVERMGEEAYTAADAVVVGSLLISLVRHADRVASACLAQLVNVIAPIRAEPDGPAWRQTTFHPFSLAARHARGQALAVPITVGTLPTAKYGDVAPVDAVATVDDETRSLALFVVNRHPTEAVDLTLDLRSWSEELSLGESLVVHEDDPQAVNTAAEPDRVIPRPLTGVSLVDGCLRLSLAAISWSTTTIELGRSR
ncbi:MAG: alpha-L-arabinofuranosidase [Chloroflexi bacterium]|nr:alpha-L-arabinofuranosidase [Chloroflexota bacterium]